MKKILATVFVATIAANVAMASFDSTSFEYEPQRIYGTGQFNVDSGWFAIPSGDTSGEWSEIRAYGENEAPTNTAGNAYLHVNNLSLLTRKVDSAGSSEIGDSGLYVDMMVKFSTCDAVPDMGEADKISVWMAEADGTKQLVVSAARLNSNLASATLTNYVVTVDGFTPDTNSWHRLVIKSYNSIGTLVDGVTVPAFLVYVDGNPATIAGALDFGEPTLVNTTPPTSGDWISDSSLDGKVDAGLVAAYGANQLFPSYDGAGIPYQQNAPTLAAVGFVGIGDIDLHSVTNRDPLATTYDTASLTIVLEYQGGNQDGATVTNAPIVGLHAGEEAEFTITPVDGYAVSRAVVEGVGDASGIRAGANTYPMPSQLTIPAYTMIVTLAPCVATVGGVAYDDFVTAVTAANGTTNPVVLVSNVTLTYDGEYVLALESSNDAVSIDLNGHAINIANGSDYNEFGIYVDGGSLTITNSSSQIAPLSATTGAFVTCKDGTLTIQGGTYNSNVIDENNCCTITGGRFLGTVFTTENDFTLKDCVPDGVGVVAPDSESGYWIVGDGDGTGGDEPAVEWPATWNSDADESIKDKFADWMTANHVSDFANNHAEEAFLLNVAPAASLSLDATAITVDANGKVTITANKDLSASAVNGVVYVLTGTQVDKISTPVAVAVGVLDIEAGTGASAGTSTLELAPGESVAPVKFYKVGVGYKVPDAPVEEP